MAESRRLLLIDAGNTNIKIGIAEKRTIRESFVLPTSLQETPDGFGMKILDLCRFSGLDPGNVDAWVVSSVVPMLDGLIRRAGQRFFDCPVHFVPSDIPLPLENRYANPREVGADRLVTAYAARSRTEAECIVVVDFGTATTVESIRDWSYLGGLICPGVLSSLKALGGQTAKLPQISLDLASTEMRIGIDTATSLNQGFIFGFASMIEGICQRLKQVLGSETRVIATGGFAEKVRPACPVLDEVVPDLLLQGLVLAFEQEAGKGGQARPGQTSPAAGPGRAV
jgi:type III pantothenate kinase